MKTLTMTFVFSTLCLSAIGQEHEAEHEFKHNRVMVVLGHANIPTGIDVEGRKKWLVLGSWGLDYDYRFNEQWILGLHTDWVVENFEVEGGEGEELLQRKRPLTLAVVGSKKWGEHFGLMLGGGVELAEEDNLELLRVGPEYSWELPGDWELAIEFVVDIKFEAYTSWTLGFGIGKLF